jgi:anti-sigma B factor antagonist
VPHELMLRVTHTVRAGSPVVLLVGELDLATVPTLHDELAGYQTGSLVLDLSRLSFMDVTGLNALLAVEARGVRLCLRAPSYGVTRMLRVLGLYERLTAEPE